MAKIPLRSYNHDIEKLIDQGQFEEAIAHCRFIFQTFPKHLETYRLLGKSYLENERYGEAADIFLRVLSSAPDDFVSNIGMSIIREDEGNLDSAIWHMERAYEVQPSNAAVQGELRRLYGRRDGLEPTRIRLTRGALARMYVRGDLYHQAVAEARAGLSEEPQRPDLQILLARMCYVLGQRVEATELCSTLLTRFPYCYEANMILAEILPGTKRAADAQIYRMRINALDPYAAFTSTEMPDVSDVPETAVMIDRLDWQPSAPVTEQPQWATTLGINVFDRGKTEDNIPDWFTEPEVPTRSQAAESVQQVLENEQAVTLPLEPGVDETIEELKQSTIPDWMAKAGWVESSEQADQPPATIESAPVETETGTETMEEIQPAAIPDWLKDLAPKEVLEETGLPDDTKEFETLFPSTPLPTETPIIEIEPVEPVPAQNLTPLGFEEQTELVLPSAQPTLDDQDAALAWLEGLAAKQGAEEETLFVKPEDRTEQPPEWISESTTIAPVLEPEAPAVEEPSLFIPVETTTQTPVELSTAEPQAATIPNPEDQDGAFAWLESLAAKQGADEETLLVRPEDRIETPPDWILESGGTSAEVKEEFPEQAETNLSAEQLLETEITATQPSPSKTEAVSEPALTDQDSAFAWLESLAAKQGAEEETLLLKPEDRSEIPPDWVHEAIPSAQAVENIEVPTREETPLAEILPIPVEETQPILDELPDWLKGLEETPGATITGPSGADQPISIETDKDNLLVTPTESIKMPPEWVLESTPQAPAVEPTLPKPEEALPPSGSEVADWLRDLEISEDQQSSSEPTPETKAVDITWLQELKETSRGVPSKEIPIPPPPAPALSVEAQMLPLVTDHVVSQPGISVDASQYSQTLKNAQFCLTEGKLAESVLGYNQLIVAGQSIEEIIHDLRDALIKYPVDIPIWQALGDAYVRTNRLQDALNAYTQAEELIR